MNDATHFWHAYRTGRTRPRGRAPEPTRPGTPPPRTTWCIARRGLLRALFASATVAFTATALSRIPDAEPYGEPAVASGPQADDGFTFDEMHTGHRIQGWPVQADSTDVVVFVDGRQLDLMRRADGSYLSSVDHYESYATAREAARAAAAELGAARLASVPVHGSHEGKPAVVYTRKNQRNLTSAERKAFVSAVLELKRSGGYDEFVRTHIDFYVSDGEDKLRVAHMAPSFLPWHRQFLLAFERALQRINSRVTVPYWDWTRDNSPASSIWSDDFMGGNGRRGDLQVMTGPFAYAHGKWEISVNVTEGRFLTRDMGRPSDPIGLPAPADVARALDDPVYDVAPWNSTSNTGFRNKTEGWTTGSGNARFRNHNQVHRWVGGVMVGAASVNDPVFWLHHAYIDSLWSRWQAAHPKAKRYLPDVPPPEGDPQHGRVAALNEPMPPFNVMPSALLDHSTIYRYA